MAASACAPSLARAASTQRTGREPRARVQSKHGTLRRECARCAYCCRARACRPSGRHAACRGRSIGWPRRRDASESRQSTGGAGRDVVREPFCAL
eukprot:1359262-Prymnesium_polylepis.1